MVFGDLVIVVGVIGIGSVVGLQWMDVGCYEYDVLWFDFDIVEQVGNGLCQIGNFFCDDCVVGGIVYCDFGGFEQDCVIEWIGDDYVFSVVVEIEGVVCYVFEECGIMDQEMGVFDWVDVGG